MTVQPLERANQLKRAFGLLHPIYHIRPGRRGTPKSEGRWRAGPDTIPGKRRSRPASALSTSRAGSNDESMPTSLIWSSSGAGSAAWRRPRWPGIGASGWPCWSPTPSSAAAPGTSAEGPYTFDAGATALDGPGPRRADRRAAGPDRGRLPVEPDPRLPRPPARPDARRRPRSSRRSKRPPPLGVPRPGGARRLFWRLQEAVGTRLFGSPAESPGCRSGPFRRRDPRPQDPRPGRAAGGLDVDRHGPGRLKVARPRSRRPVPLPGRDAPPGHGAGGPETVPFANAAACLQAYRLPG